MKAISSDHLEAIRLHLQRQHALGPKRFRIAIETQLARRVGPRQDRSPPQATQAWESAL